MSGLDPLPTLAELVWPRRVTEIAVPSGSGCGRRAPVLYLIGREPTALDNPPPPRLPVVEVAVPSDSGCGRRGTVLQIIGSRARRG